MKLLEFNNEAALISQQNAIDIDVATRLGPEIAKHINALEALCRIMPNPMAILAKLAELKAVVSQSVAPSANILEQIKVVEMYSSLYPQFGESTWAVVSRTLREQGYDKPTVDSMIDQAILHV